MEDFSSSEIKKSFEGPTEDQEEDAKRGEEEEELSVLGNKPNK